MLDFDVEHTQMPRIKEMCPKNSYYTLQTVAPFQNWLPHIHVLDSDPTFVCFRQREISDALVGAHEEVDRMEETVGESSLGLLYLYDTIGSLEKVEDGGREEEGEGRRGREEWERGREEREGGTGGEGRRSGRIRKEEKVGGEGGKRGREGREGEEKGKRGDVRRREKTKSM